MKKKFVTFTTLGNNTEMSSHQNVKFPPQGFMAILNSVLNTNFFNKNVSKLVKNKSGGISREDVINAQKAWGYGIVAIGKAYMNGEDYRALAAEIIDMLYGYDEGTVLFKPRKAVEEEFRLTKEEAISYFVQGIFCDDRGFALQPWSKVRFENAGVIVNYHYALAVGDYYFTDAHTGQEIKADFTFGYKKNESGQLLIDLHHSSFPYHSDS